MENRKMKFTNEIVWSLPEGTEIRGVLHAVTCRVNRNGKYYAWLIDDGERCVNYVFNATLYQMVKVAVSVGSEIEITYRGKEDLGSGKSMKIYDLEVLHPNPEGPMIYETVEEIPEEAEESEVDGNG